LYILRDPALRAGAESIDSRQDAAGNDPAEAAWQSLQAKFPRLLVSHT
jgi:hypothetical protein